MKTIRDLESILRSSKKEWRWEVVLTIQDIPSGYICTYGEIAAETRKRSCLSISVRNVAWLRKHLYALTKRSTSIPLHRLAKAHDTRCVADSERTRRKTSRMRFDEGFWGNPRWWRFP